MEDYTFDFDMSSAELFYNACHNPKDGTFCGRGKGGKFPKRAVIVPMSAKAAKSYARAQAYAKRKRTNQKSAATKATNQAKAKRSSAAQKAAETRRKNAAAKKSDQKFDNSRSGQRSAEKRANTKERDAETARRQALIEATKSRGSRRANVSALRGG